MAAAKDLKIDSDGDLYIDPLTGDLKIDFSDKQHIKDIINSNVGWYKQFPLVGVGIVYYVKSSGLQQQLEREIRLQLKSDGYSMERPKIISNPDGTFLIQPNAIRN
ncbi:MAG: hypothetical protein V4538_16235 [Bacteroidota bacterium]